MDEFTRQKVAELKKDTKSIQERASRMKKSDDPHELIEVQARQDGACSVCCLNHEVALGSLYAPQEAKHVGDKFLTLEKYVNLNYLVRLKLWQHGLPSCNNEEQACMHACLAAHKESPLNIVLCRQGFHKILKKHDKQLPETPCQSYYVQHLHSQSWVQVASSVLF